MDNTNTARAEYATYCTEIGTTVEDEMVTLLSVDDRYLPPCAVAVRDGEEPTADFWTWAREQTERAHDEADDGSNEPTTTIWTIHNNAYYAPMPGKVRAYLDRDERDAALVSLRRTAIANGLATQAAQAGIWGSCQECDDERIVDMVDADPGMLIEAE